MTNTLTDEEAVAFSEELIERVARAFYSICAQVSILEREVLLEAMSHVLWMVNGRDWISASDMARARVRAKGMGAK
jgi:hypothetical protein